MGTLFSLIGALAAIVGIGAAISSKISFGSDVKQTLVMIIINVAMPCMLLNSLFSLPVDNALLQEIGLVLLLSVGVHSLGIAMGWFGSFTLKVSGQKRKELAVLAGLGNTGFIGIPMCAVLFGAKGAMLAAVFDSGLDLVIWTYVQN
jgi:predicted permease